MTVIIETPQAAAYHIITTAQAHTPAPVTLEVAPTALSPDTRIQAQWVNGTLNTTITGHGTASLTTAEHTLTQVIIDLLEPIYTPF